MLRVISKSEIKTASDSRQYMLVQFMDSINPFAGTRGKMVRQQFSTKSSEDLAYPDTNPKWTVEPSIIDELIKNKTAVPGEIVTKKVPTYEVGGREVNTFTAVVLGHESVTAVFKASGHELEEITTQESAIESVGIVSPEVVNELVVA